MPSLIEKFTDSKILVRTANLKLLKRIMGSLEPSVVLELLGRGMAHASAKVREEIVNTAIMVRGGLVAHSGRSTYPTVHAR